MKRKIYWIYTGLLVLLLAAFASPAYATSPAQGEDPKTKAEALYQEGVALYNQADYQGAIKKFAEALTIYQEIGDRQAEGITLNNIGLIYDTLGQYEQALDYDQQALTIMRQLSDQDGEGRMLNDIGLVYRSLGQYQKALDFLQQALTLRQKVGNRAGEGVTLNNIGLVYDTLGQYQQALDYYQQALAIMQEIGNRANQGIILYGIGSAYSSLAQYDQALDYDQRALAISREVNDRETEGRTLSDLGAISDHLGQYQEALNYYQQALKIMKEIGFRKGEGTALNNIGEAHTNLGQYSQALDSLQQALTIAKEIQDRDGEGVALGNIAQVYVNRGQYQQALEYDQQALAIFRELGEQGAEATTFDNIGVIYQNLAQSTRALDYYQQALAIWQKIGDQSGEGRTLNNIGAVYRQLRQYEQSLDYYQQALAISQKIGDQAGEETTLRNIGFAHHMLEQYSQALDYYRQALVISQEIGDLAGEGLTLNNMAFVYDVSKQYPKALDYYQQALPILKEVGQQAWEAATLNNMGYAYEQQGDQVQAISSYKQAVEVIESIQGEIKIEELKASFLAEQAGNYELLINLLWKEGQFEEAYNYAERARARAFLDQLAGGTVNFRAGADANLLEQEQKLRDVIASFHAQLITLRNRPQNELDTKAIGTVEAELTQREADYAQLLTNIKLQSPEVASLVSVDVAPLAQVQALIDSETTLIEYFTMEDRTLAFIVTHDTLQTATLNVSRDDLTKTVTSFRDFASLNDPYPASLKQLYSWLIAPLKDKLDTPVVGIIPHGVLHYLPFAALTDGQQYLGDQYSLFTLPSASALRFIQEKRKPPTNTILAVGNPTTTEPGLSPLDFAQQEVETITKIFGSEPLIGNLATESALRSKAGNAGIIHLAAHGQYNPENPLFSQIYLADDEQNDGRLEANEIYSLDLTKATDLVVLSACQTDVGAVSAGDEVVGLTRAFLYAGTPTVIASLWNVDDKATTLLMERFYTHLREGMGKAQALQQAQSDVRAQYPHPYYWAAFVLTGDPGKAGEVNTVRVPGKNKSAIWITGLVGMLFLLISGATVLRKRIRRIKS